MSKKQKISFYLNHREFGNWFTRLYNVILTSIEWDNIPDSIDPRFLEQTLFWQGRAVWFKDDILGQLALPITNTSTFDWYGNLTECFAHSYNYMSGRLYCSPWSIDGKMNHEQNAVVIYNNTARMTEVQMLLAYAERLSKIDRIIDINVNAQKTPVLILCDEGERLSLANLYASMDNNEPVIFGTKELDPNAVRSISTKADFTSLDLFTLRKLIVQDCLSYYGIESNVSEKQERVLSGEITSNMGQIESNRQTRLFPRQQAVDKINEIFGENIEVKFRSNLDLSKIMEGVNPNYVTAYNPAHAPMEPTI